MNDTNETTIPAVFAKAFYAFGFVHGAAHQSGELRPDDRPADFSDLADSAAAVAQFYEGQNEQHLAERMRLAAESLYAAAAAAPPPVVH